MMPDFTKLNPIHIICHELMFNWQVRYAEADGSWEFYLLGLADERFCYEGNFDLGVAEVLKYLQTIISPT